MVSSSSREYLERNVPVVPSDNFMLRMYFFSIYASSGSESCPIACGLPRMKSQIQFRA